MMDLIIIVCCLFIFISVPSANAQSGTTCPSITQFGGTPSGTADNTAALAAAIASAPPGKICVFFPAGRWGFANAQSYTFASTQASITIEGAGQDVTELYFSNSTSGLNFNYNGAFDSVHIKNLSITTAAANSGTVAISLKQNQPSNSDPGNTALSDISNVTIRGADGYLVGDHWGTGVMVSSVSNVNFYGDYIIGPAGNGVVLQGTSANIPVVFNFTNTFFNNLTTGIVYGNYVQGVTVSQCNFTGDQFGINAPSGESGLVQLIVMNSQFNNFSSSISTGTGIQDLQLVGNLFLVQPNTVSLNLQHTQATAIIGNTFEPQGAKNNNYGIVFQSYDYGASTVTGNSFYSVTNAIVLTASAQNVNVQSNAYYDTNNKVINSCGTCTVGGGSM